MHLPPNKQKKKTQYPYIIFRAHILPLHLHTLEHLAEACSHTYVVSLRLLLPLLDCLTQEQVLRCGNPLCKRKERRKKQKRESKRSKDVVRGAQNQLN